MDWAATSRTCHWTPSRCSTTTPPKPDSSFDHHENPSADHAWWRRHRPPFLSHERFGGFVLSAAINRYIYIVINRTFSDEYLIKYSELERTKDVDLIEHPIVREALRLHPMERGIELVSVADIPAGTGPSARLVRLHSSASCGPSMATGGSTSPRRTWRRRHARSRSSGWNGRPVGKQDQYIAAAFGGPDVPVVPTRWTGERFARSSYPIRHAPESGGAPLHVLHRILTRAADGVLGDQKIRSEQGDKEMLGKPPLCKGERPRYQGRTRTWRHVGLRRPDARSLAQQTEAFGRHVQLPDRRVVRQGTRSWRTGREARRGAGSGGFLLFYAKDQDMLRKAMVDEGLTEVRFTFDHDGSNVLVRD